MFQAKCYFNTNHKPNILGPEKLYADTDDNSNHLQFFF